MPYISITPNWRISGLSNRNPQFIEAFKTDTNVLSKCDVQQISWTYVSLKGYRPSTGLTRLIFYDFYGA